MPISTKLIEWQAPCRHKHVSYAVGEQNKRFLLRKKYRIPDIGYAIYLPGFSVDSILRAWILFE